MQRNKQTKNLTKPPRNSAHVFLRLCCVSGTRASGGLYTADAPQVLGVGDSVCMDATSPRIRARALWGVHWWLARGQVMDTSWKLS